MTRRERLHLCVAMVLVPLSATLWIAAGITLFIGGFSMDVDRVEDPALLPQVLFWAVPAAVLALASAVWFRPRYRASRLPWALLGGLLLTPALLILGANV